ncbi:hypothetical protein JOF53_008002 [Crossiella equi]|uniref:Uncharacterized protein n=1 Tax=Crossiella equi TaxID=130796 RepID=A0ABS5ARF1_9PSEU|nr:hypothetical protein [Crossiella equi]MBP2479130.1 hypothetical protein [Crossiella equi]
MTIVQFDTDLRIGDLIWFQDEPEKMIHRVKVAARDRQHVQVLSGCDRYVSNAVAVGAVKGKRAGSMTCLACVERLKQFGYVASDWR